VNAQAFHDHLDQCPNCANRPFDLCDEGERLIREAVGHCGHGHCNHPPKCTGTGEPDERDPLGCCNCGTREKEKTDGR